MMLVRLFLLGFALSGASSFCYGQQTLKESKLLPVPLGKVVNATIIELRPINNEDVEVKIKIEDARAVVIRLADIRVFNRRGHPIIASVLQYFVGKKVKIYEVKQYLAFPAGFWDGESPVSTDRKFGLYPLFTVLIPTDSSVEQIARSRTTSTLAPRTSPIRPPTLPPMK